MKLKVGDEVRVQQWVGRPYAGMTGRIISVHSYYYRIDGIDGKWDDRGVELIGGDSDLF